MLLFSASASGAACTANPPLDVAPNVDLSRFQGKWYEIARLPRATQTDCNGTTAFYTSNSDGTYSFVNQCNVGSATGPLSTVSMTASVPDNTVPAKMTLDVGGYAGDYWILEVGSNYEYAVVGHPSREYLWILSRTATLDTPTMQGIVNRAQTNQFDTSKLEYTPQPPAGERDSMSTPEGPVPPAVRTGCAVSWGAPDAIAPWVALLGVAAALGMRRRRPIDARG